MPEDSYKVCNPILVGDEYIREKKKVPGGLAVVKYLFSCLDEVFSAQELFEDTLFSCPLQEFLYVLHHKLLCSQNV